jgi:hypothetical protein
VSFDCLRGYAHFVTFAALLYHPRAAGPYSAGQFFDEKAEEGGDIAMLGHS